MFTMLASTVVKALNRRHRDRLRNIYRIVEHQSRIKFWWPRRHQSHAQSIIRAHCRAIRTLRTDL